MNIHSIDFVRGMVSAADLPGDDLPQIAFVGRSNVGKSSLLNRILNKEVCRTSKTPGRTQQANLFRVNNTFYVVDLPGYGFAKVSLPQRKALDELIYGYLGDEEVPIKRVVVVVDASGPMSPLDTEMLNFLLRNERSVVIAGNKWDKLNQKEQNAAKQHFVKNYPHVDWIPCSAKSGMGIDILRRYLYLFSTG